MSKLYTLSDQITIGLDAVFDDLAKSYEICSRLDMKPSSCRLTMQDPEGSVLEAAAADAYLGFDWVINNGEAQPLFTGTVKSAKDTEPETVRIVGYDAYRKLLTEKITVTLQRQTPDRMIRTLIVEKLGIAEVDIDECPTEIVRLPLYRTTAHEAIRQLHQQLDAVYDCYVNETGVFVWKVRNYAQEAAYEFELGFDCDEFDQTNKTFLTEGVALKLGQVVGLIDHQDTYHTLFIVGLDRFDFGAGAQIKVYFVEVPSE